MLRPSGYLIFQPEKKEPLAGEALVRVNGAGYSLHGIRPIQ